MIAQLCNFLTQWAVSLGVTIANFFIDFLNAAIVAFVALIVAIANLLPSGINLPQMPAVPSSAAWTAFVEGLCWLFPISFIVQSFAFVTASLLAYALIAPLARWAKLLR